MIFQSYKNVLFANFLRTMKQCRGDGDSRQIAVLSLALVSLLFCVGTAHADTWQQTVSARAATEYDTNPAMAPGYRDDGLWRMMLDPAYRLTGTFGVNEYQSGAALHAEHSSNTNISQNRNDPSIFLNWKHQVETGDLGIGARYDEVGTRTTELNNIGLVTTDGTRASRAVTANWKESFSERNTFEANVSHTDYVYKDVALINYVTQSGVLKYSYLWSVNSTPFVSLAYDDYTATDNSLVYHNYSSMLGLNWRSSAQLDGTVKIGQFRSDSGNGEGTQGGVSVRYAGLQNSSSVNAERQVMATGLGGFTIVDQVNGGWSYQVSDSSTTGIDLGWSKSHFVTDNYFRSSGVWLQHDLDSLWQMRLYLQHRASVGDGVAEALSNILGLSLTYTHPDF